MKILLLDNNADYSERVKHYVEKKYLDIQITVCDNIDSLKKVFKDEKFDVVLFDSEYDNIPSEELNTYIGNAVFAYISSTQEVINEKDTIYKYLSVSGLHSQICSLYEKKKNRVVLKDVNVEKPDTEVIVFLPTNGGVGCSTMASACSIALAKDNPVLYINMEQMPSDSVFFKGNGKKCLSDIISILKTKYTETSVYQILKEVIQEDKNQNYAKVSFIKGYNNVMDSISMKDQYIDIVIGILKSKFDFKYIIIDSNFIVGDVLNKILAVSDKAVFVSSGSDISNIKMAEIQRYLDILTRDDEIEMPENYIVFNQFYQTTNNAPVYQGMTVVESFARYRTNNGTRISSQDIIEQVLTKKDAFSKLVSEDFRE